MAHKDFESLRKAILEKAQKGTKDSVLPVVQDQMVKSIDEVVYDAYNPIKYHDRRRYSNGGLADESQIRGKVSDERNNGFTFAIRNEAEAVRGNAEIAPLIIKGQTWALLNGYEVYHERISSYSTMLMYNSEPFTPYFEPRDFITHTIENLNKLTLANKLKSYMNK